MRSQAGWRYRSNGFSLAELLIVMAIIGVLVAVLLPMASKVRLAARNTSTTNTISQISRAIDAYYTDFRAYPGPLAYNEINNKNAAAASWFYNSATGTTSALSIVTVNPPAGFDLTSQTAAQFAKKFSDSENLVLGLLGGLRVGVAGTDAGKLIYDPSLIGQGPTSLGQSGPAKRNSAYMEATNLSWHDTPTGKTGHFADEPFDASAAQADDTIVPEFIDAYTSPMPILYMRARVGVTAVPESATPTATVNGIVTFDAAETAARVGTYDLHQIIGYTGSYSGTWPGSLVLQAPMGGGLSIGEGKVLPLAYNGATGSKPSIPYHGLTTVDPAKTANKGASTYQYPFDAYPYLRSPTSSIASPVPQQKGGYILISAGPDRVYGTSDDITNFGSVGQ